MIEEYLVKLGKMLRRRQRPSFKQDLRSQLLARAEELNHEPVKQGFDLNAFFNGTLFSRRIAPATAALLIVVLLFQFVLPGAGFKAPSLVNVAEAKDYYTLTPETEDAAGVAGDSSFVLASKGKITVDEVEEVLSVEPAVELTLEQKSTNEIVVTPVETLDAGEVYSFTLEAQNLEEAPYPKEFSWAYEVSDGFRITGTLPGKQEAGVPTNTGIEVYFTHNGVSVDEFEKAFSISPAISGNFSVDGKTAVFAPSGGLLDSTVYTVTLAGSLPLAGTDKTLGEDYSFEFETSSEERGTSNLSLTKTIYEFSPDENPSFKVNYWNDNGDEENLTLSVGVYQYDSGENYAAALDKYRDDVPGWCYYQKKIYRVPTEGLSKVVDSPEFATTQDDYGRDTIQLPGSLPEGYYLLQVAKNGELSQAFVQISNTAVYINLNAQNSLVWVNDIESSKPIADAEVSFGGYPLSAQTDADGVATFEDLFSALDLAPENNNSLLLTVTANNRSTYYDTNFYTYLDRANDHYWQMLKTERETYQPTDTLYYWGFVQGRDAPVAQDAELYVTSGYSVWNMDAADIESGDEVVHKEGLILSDGEAFEGRLELEKYAPGSYGLVIIQDGKVLTNTSFNVDAYVKPAYQIVAETDKSALFVGDTAHITLTARFFEGTPVVNTELRVMTPDGGEQILTTNENGQILLDWVATMDSCDGGNWCGLMNYPSLSVSPVQEELGEIQTGIEFLVFRAKTILEMNYGDFTTSSINFKAYKVDLAAIDYDRTKYEGESSVYGAPDSESQVDMVVTKNEWIQTETGEYYDEVDKVVRKEYDRTLEQTQVVEESLNPNGNGEYEYAANLEEGFNYDVDFTIHDEEGAEYKDSNGIYSASGDYYSSSSYRYLNLSTGEPQGEQALYKQGEQVTVTASSSDEEEVLEDLGGSYLFMQEHVGVQDFSVETIPEYSFTFGEEDVPNVVIDAVMFDGDHYRVGWGTEVWLDTSDRRMTVEVSADKDLYEPGETVELSVNTGEAAQVNLYLVDEAYYALFAESFRDPLELLYSDVSSGVNYTYISHRFEENDDGGKGGCFVAGTQILMSDGSLKAIEDVAAGDFILTKQSAWSPVLVPEQVLSTTALEVGETLLVNGTLGVTEEHILFINGKFQLARDLKVGDVLLNVEGENVGVSSIEKIRQKETVYNFEVAEKHTYFADGIYVHNDKGETREDFRDTALFTLVQTDADGKATVSFELPDNITSWRISAAAVSGGNEIKAGFTSANINVSKDVFVTPILNSEYLTGDVPSVPVRAYGDALSTGEDLNFSMSIEAISYEAAQVGKAFETTYFELPTLNEGDYVVETSVEAEGGEDTVALPMSVMDSHFTVGSSDEFNLSENTQLSGSETERTTVSFINGEMDDIYSFLQGELYEEGDRADQALATTLAAQWFNSYFGAAEMVPDFSSFIYQDVDQYSDGDGGVALLPYADSSLELSAKMAVIAPEQFSQQKLREYFEEVLNNPDRTLSEKILSLYGLAGLGDSFLTELNYFVANYELSSEDKLYAALAYAQYGDDLQATDLLLELMAENHEDAAFMAQLATLTEQVGSDQSEAVWASALQLESEGKGTTGLRPGDFILLEKLQYVQSRLERGSQGTVSFKLNGEKIELEGDQIYTKSFLPEELSSLEFTDFSGEVTAITAYQTPVDLENLNTEDGLKITRSYQVNGQTVDSVSSGDIVEVHFKISISSALRNQGFKVTDYLPSGLQTATWPNSISRQVNEGSKFRNPYEHDGQAVSFYVSCYEDVCYGTDFYYLARVVNPGTFILEPAAIQSFKDAEVLNISGQRERMDIR